MNLFIFLLLVFSVCHVVLFQRASDTRRARRLVLSLLSLGLSIAMLVVGILLGLGGDSNYQTLAMILIYAPVYMSALSFSVYFIWPRNKT